jgi:hypothetical protein
VFTVFTLRLLEAKENMIMAMSVLDDHGHTGRHLHTCHTCSAACEGSLRESLMVSLLRTPPAAQISHQASSP